MNNLLFIALQEYGVTEIPGDENNPRIIQYAKDIGYGSSILSETTAWCSVFINWCAMMAGLERSGKLNARSWLKIGKEIEEPKLGDVVIFWREKEDSWKGHVSIFINYSEDKKYIYCLGGNQKNSVCVRPYYSKKVLGFRRLST